VSNPQVHDSQKSVPSTQPKTFKQDSVSCLSEDENTNARLSTSLAGGPATMLTRTGVRPRSN